MLENEIILNENHLVYNYQYYKNKINKNIIAVLKANAYGHGLPLIAKSLDSLNVYMIAVSNISEGILLRQHNIKTRILILEPIDLKDMLNCYYYHLTPTISSLYQFNKLNKANFFASLPFHLKIDTGMHRLGINNEEALIIKEKLNNSNNLVLKGIYSHLIGEEKEINYIKNQQDKFIDAVNIFKDYNDLTIHLSSTKFINQDLDICNSIRIGLGLYGLDDQNTKQVLSLYSPIINVRKIKKGDYSSYNNSFKAPKDGYIYTIPIGYFHGLLRKYKLSFKIDNKTLKLAGNKCMNQILLYSTKQYNIKDVVTIIDEELSLKSIAKRNNISIYELVSLLHPSIKRRIE